MREMEGERMGPLRASSAAATRIPHRQEPPLPLGARIFPAAAEADSCRRSRNRKSFSFKENQEILTGWEKDIAAIARNIIDEQSPKQLYMIRSKLKNLIEYDVSPDFIFSTLIVELKKNLDAHLQNRIDALYQEYSFVNPKYTASLLDVDQSLKISSDKDPESGKRTPDTRKNVHHFMRIEEFTAKFMSCYKAQLMNNAGGTSGY